MNHPTHPRTAGIAALLALLLWSAGLLAAADKRVISESIIQLREDGRSYIQHRAMRTDWSQYEFHVNKHLGLKDFFYIYPNDFEWDDKSSPTSNILKFRQGTFVVMYPGKFEGEVTQDDDGVFTFSSWDGKKREDGLFGFWNTPGNFSRFVYAWMFPEKFEILEYKSNVEGEWVERNNTISFFAENVNNVTFTIKYRARKKTPVPPPVLPDGDGDGVVDLVDRCPQTVAGTKVGPLGCEVDSDNDGVVDSKDQCPGTPGCIRVDEHGCELDGDGDGVTDSADECPETPAGAKVDERGCELDGDGDGVADGSDKCPETPAGAKVDEKGCEHDSDGDGVTDSADQCPETPAGAKVDERGCELDGDGDGVADGSDKCPETPAGVKVDERGCEFDSDGDGVTDSKDKCPKTPEGRKVDASGCSPDADDDGVADDVDQCPGTPAGASVDAKGCEADSDGDGVTDSKDKCPKTPEGHKVDASGCPPDADGDGVTDAIDLCPKSASGANVDATGCSVTATITLEGVTFETGSAQLKPASLDVLDRVAASLKASPALRVEVAGHTDSSGNDMLNMELSQSRAEAVVEYLISAGVGRDRLQARGYGETRPVADNATAEGRARNRRVELKRLGD